MFFGALRAGHPQWFEAGSDERPPASSPGEAVAREMLERDPEALCRCAHTLREHPMRGVCLWSVQTNPAPPGARVRCFCAGFRPSGS